MDWITKLKTDQLGILFVTVAVFVGGIVSIMRLFLRHRERMTMIEQGMNPDASGKKEDD